MRKIKIHVLNIQGGGFHILIKCKINDISGMLLIDTGASNSIFDLNLENFDKNNLIPLEDEITSSGFNSTIEELYSGEIKNLKIGSFNTQIENAIFTSLDYINALYLSMDLTKILGIIGCDFLFKHKAVIDLSQKYLYLEK
jgi:hypothetical protein